MPKVITATGIKFDEARLWKEDVDGVTKLYVSVGFAYVNAEGVPIRGSRTIELAGARKTAVANFFTNLETDILTLEGI
jgi:hypothetical protein